MAAGGKIIGRVSIKVTPDTDGFWEKVRADLAKGPNEIEIPVNPDADDLRKKVSAAAKAAEAGQKIEVPVDVDKNRVGNAIRDAASSARPAAANVDVDQDRIRRGINDATSGAKEIDLVLEDRDFQRRIEGLLKPVELPVSLDDAGKSVDNELRQIREYGPLEIPADIDTSHFSKQALEARAEATKVLEQHRARMRLEADDSDLNNKLAKARAQVKELQNTGISPKYDPNALHGFQRDLANSVMTLDKLRNRQRGLTELELFDRQKLDIDLEWVKKQIDETAQRFARMSSNPLTDTKDLEAVGKKWADLTHQASRYQRKIDEIDARPIDPKVTDNISRELKNIDRLEGKIRDMRALGSAQQYNEDLDRALATVRKIESQVARNNAQQAKISSVLDEDALNKALRVLRARTSEAVEDAQFKVNLDYSDIQRQARRAIEQARPQIRPDLAPDTRSQLQRALGRERLEIPVAADIRRLSESARQARQVAQEILNNANVQIRLDADDRELTRKLDASRDRLRELDAIRVDPDFNTRGLDRINELILRNERDLQRLNSQRIGPEVNPQLERDIERVTNRLNTLQEVGRNMSRDGVRYRVEADIDAALASHRRLETESDRLTSRRRELQYTVNPGSINAAMNVLEAQTRRGAERASNTLRTTLQRGINDAGRDSDRLGQNLSRLGSTGLRAFAGVGQAASSAGSAMGAFGRQIANIGNQMQSIAYVKQLLLSIAVVFPTLVAAAMLLGAAISAAFAVIMTAVASVVPILGGIGVAAGVVAMGFDGIKNAASTLAPEFDRLKAAASSTFEQTMTPQFERLRPLIAGLTPQIQNMATVIGSDLTGAVIDSITAFDQMRGVGQMIDMISGSLRAAAPGFRDITTAILEMVNLESGVMILTNAFNTLGASWRTNVENLIANGRMDAAFRGLDQIVQALTRSLSAMVTNGIRMLASAAPGLTATIESITNFFNRFDYDRLGTAISDVFTGISEAIDSIPAGTIERITQGFETFGQVLRSSDFQGAVSAIAEAFASLVEASGPLTQFISRSITEFQALWTAAEALAFGLKGVFQSIAAIFTGDWSGAMESFSKSGELFRRSLDLIRQDATTGVEGVASALESGAPRLGAAGAQLGPAAAAGVAQGSHALSDAVKKLTTAYELPDGTAAVVPPQWVGLGQELGLRGAEGITQNVPLVENQASILGMKMLPPPLAQSAQEEWSLVGGGSGIQAAEGLASGIPGTASAAVGLGDATKPQGELTEPWNAGTAPIPGIVEGNLAPVTPAAQGVIDQLGPVLDQAFANLGNNVQTGVQGWADKIRTGLVDTSLTIGTEFDNIITTVSEKTVAIGDAIGTNAGLWNLSVDIAMQAISTSITTGFQTIATNVSASVVAIGDAISTGASTWSTSVDTSVMAIQTSMQVAFANIAIAAQNSMTAVGSAISTGSGLWSLSIDIATQAMSTAFTNGLTGMATTASSQMTAITNVISTSSQQWSTAITTATTGISNAVQTAFAGLVSTVQSQMTAANAAIQTGAQGWATSIQSGTQNMTSSMQNAMTQITSAVQNGMNQCTAAVRSGMDQMVNAFTTGANQMVTALTGALNRAISAAQSFVGRFRAVGANMGQALADGLNSKAGAVEAAARRLANAAAAATAAAAQINSPSRVFIALGEFIGVGFANGISYSAKYAEKQGARMVDLVVDTARKVEDAFEGTSLGKEFVSDLRSEIPRAVSSVKALANGEMRHAVESEGFGSGFEDRVAEALSGWAVQIDANGMARMVNKANTRKARR